MKLVPYDGVFVKEYVGEILKSFDKFQVVPSSMKVFTTDLNGPLSTVSRQSEGRASRDTLAPAIAWYTCIKTNNDPILQRQDFVRFYDKMSYALLKRPTGSLHRHTNTTEKCWQAPKAGTVPLN